jgi:DNA ligase-1
MVNRFLFFIILSTLLFAQRPNLLLLKTYKGQDVTGWVMSEKLDGVRAYWNGKNLISRGGNIIHAPKWFTKDYPPFEIDGELWSRRGDFENISSIVREKSPSKRWREIKHYIFEVPNAKGDLFKRLEKVKPYRSDIIKIVPQTTIKSREDIKRFLEEITKNGGEGLVVRDPKAPYISKRTSKALKVKKFNDGECRVVGYNGGRGKYLNMVGSLRCELDSGLVINIGSGLTNRLRETPPKVGSTITYKYQGFTKYGKPRFPVFLRVRDAK